MAISVAHRFIVGNAAATSSVNSDTWTPTSTNAIIVMGMADTGTSGFAAPTDTLLNTYTRVQADQIVGSFAVSCWTNYNISGGSSNTINFTTGFKDCFAAFFEVAGLASSA